MDFLSKPTAFICRKDLLPNARPFLNHDISKRSSIRNFTAVLINFDITMGGWLVGGGGGGGAPV